MAVGGIGASVASSVSQMYLKALADKKEKEEAQISGSEEMAEEALNAVQAAMEQAEAKAAEGETGSPGAAQPSAPIPGFEDVAGPEESLGYADPDLAFLRLGQSSPVDVRMFQQSISMDNFFFDVNSQPSEYMQAKLAGQAAKDELDRLKEADLVKTLEELEEEEEKTPDKIKERVEEKANQAASSKTGADEAAAETQSAPPTPQTAEKTSAENKKVDVVV